MATIHHRLFIHAPAAKVYETLSSADRIHPASSPASVWTGTRFVFELAERSAPVRREARWITRDDGGFPPGRL